jgi:hypothetical protein
MSKMRQVVEKRKLCILENDVNQFNAWQREWKFTNPVARKAKQFTCWARKARRRFMCFVGIVRMCVCFVKVSGKARNV